MALILPGARFASLLPSPLALGLAVMVIANHYNDIMTGLRSRPAHVFNFVHVQPAAVADFLVMTLALAAAEAGVAVSVIVMSHLFCLLCTT